MSDSESDSDIKNKMNDSDMEEFSDDQKLKEKQSTENSTKNQTKENSLNIPKKEEKKIKEESSDSDDSSEENKKKEKEKEKEKEKIKEDKKEDFKEDIKEEKQKKRKKSDSSDSSDSSSDSENKDKNIKKSNQTKEKVSEKNENDENAKKQKEIEENERKERDKKKKEDEERKKKEEEDRRKKEEEKRKKEEEDIREKNNNANFRFQREDKKFEEKYEYSSRSNYNNNFRRSENYNQNNNYENRYNQQESTYTKKKAKKYDYNTEKILNNIITDNIEIIDEMMNAYPGIMKLDCANILKKIKKNTSSYTLFEIMNNVHRDISIDITLNKENEENQNNLSQIDPYEVIDNFYNNPDHVKMMKYYKVFSLEDKEKLPPYLQESLPKNFYYNKNKEKEERRRKLIKYSDGSFNYIPVNCQKNCENNENCVYAHNDNENEYHPLFYKTILSNNLGHGNDKRLVKGATNLFEDFRIIYNYKNESIIKLMNLFCEKKFSKFSFKEYLKNKIESFSLNTFKTMECPSVKSGLKCPKEDSHLCYYYHDKQEKRRPPTLYRYTNEICKNQIIKKGKIREKCKNGEFCNKCHSKYELYYHILFYGKAMTCIRPRKLGKCIFEETCYAYHPYMEPGYKKTKEEIIKEEKDKRLDQYTKENKALNNLIEKFRCPGCESFKKRLNYCLLLTCNHIICSKCFKTSEKCPKCNKKIKKDKEGEDFIQIDITDSSNNIDELMKKNYDKKKEEEKKAETDKEKNINKEEEKEKSKKKNESESDDEEEEKEDNNKDSENDNDCNKSM